MVWLYLLFAVAAGAMLPFQFGVNAQLSHWIGSPIRAAFVSFLVGTIALLIVSAFVRKPMPSLARLGDVPWWVWIGGLLGAFYVARSSARSSSRRGPGTVCRCLRPPRAGASPSSWGRGRGAWSLGWLPAPLRV